MKVGIAIDDYKLEIFKEHLDEADYEYEVLPGITENTRMIYVTIDKSEVRELYKITLKANSAAQKKVQH